MKILVLNCGSSSVKFKLFETQGYLVLARGEADRIGIEGAAFVYEAKGRERVRHERPLRDQREAVARPPGGRAPVPQAGAFEPRLEGRWPPLGRRDRGSPRYLELTPLP